MAMSNDDVLKFVNKNMYGTLVTYGNNGLRSRTMTFGFVPLDKIFMATHNGTAKLDDIDFSKKGLIHISNICENVTLSIDVSIEGSFEIIEPGNALYKIGVETLGKKNPHLADILNDEYSRCNYTMMLLKIQHFSAWDYMQSLNGEPKTILV